MKEVRVNYNVAPILNMQRTKEESVSRVEYNIFSHKPAHYIHSAPLSDDSNGKPNIIINLYTRTSRWCSLVYCNPISCVKTF